MSPTSSAMWLNQRRALFLLQPWHSLVKDLKDTGHSKPWPNTILSLVSYNAEFVATNTVIR